MSPRIKAGWQTALLHVVCVADALRQQQSVGHVPLILATSAVMEVQHAEVQQPIRKVQGVVALRISHDHLHQTCSHHGLLMSQGFHEVRHEAVSLHLRKDVEKEVGWLQYRWFLGSPWNLQIPS